MGPGRNDVPQAKQAALGLTAAKMNPAGTARNFSPVTLILALRLASTTSRRRDGWKLAAAKSWKNLQPSLRD